ncbi:MAG TPA: acetamidase/formamidase family protein [Trebonia sp.]|nr:acetamidase/formamidase family protein [Trebonia sp.]
MTVHRIEPAPESTVNVFSASHAPLVVIDPGDTIIARSLDASGYLERHEFPGDAGKPKMPSGEGRGHCLNRPVAVRGAVPGGMLAVHIVALTPDDWGWTVTASAPDSPVARRLGLAGAEPAWLLWEIDQAAGTAIANGKYARPIAPFLGITGVAPAGEGQHSTVPPRTEAGGNIDCKELVAGSTLYLPVNADGALLYLGDGHAAQGDGESCGTAIECGMTTEAVVRLAPGRPLSSVHAETPAGRVTFGFSADLNEAMGDALDAMVTWLAELYRTSRAEALLLASSCVDLRVTQVANITWGVHALLPAGLLDVVSA